MNLFKNLSLTLLAGHLSCLAFGQAKDFTISVKLPSAPQNAILLLNRIDALSGKRVNDSAILDNGMAKFAASTLYPQKAVLLLKTKNSKVLDENIKDRLTVYLESGNISVSGNDNLKTARVGGTRLNEDSQAFYRCQKRIFAKGG